jgi:sugar phosphate isomerase/epimerase
MKLAVAIATADAPPSAFVVWRGLAASMAKAAALGYDGVELALADAGQADCDEIARLCDIHGLEISAISTRQVYAVHGLYLTHPDPDKRRQTVACLQGLVDVAARFGRKVNLGRARGMVQPDEPVEAASARFLSAARHLAAYAGERGVEILLEPVNRYELNFINSVAEGAELLADLNMPNMRLMPDVFHMNIEDDSIPAALTRHAPLISYIHFADSNRRAPGQGHLHFPEIVATLKALNYAGWVTVEILPLPDPDAAARAAVQYLRPLIPKLEERG